MVLAMVLMSSTAFAQLTSSYFMPGSTFRSELNPAFRPTRGYISLPGVGGASAAFMSNSLTLDNLFYPVDGKLVPFLNPNVEAQPFLASLAEENNLNALANVNVFALGTYIGRGFLTLDFDIKTDVQANLPYELFDFLKNSQSGHSYGLAGTSLSAAVNAEIALGYSRELFKGFTLGVRGKYIGGVGYAKMNFQQLDLALNEDAWGISSDGVAEVAMSGMRIPTDADGVWDFDNIEFGDPQHLAGTGAALDLGVTYDLGFARLSASVLNLGFMKWDEQYVQRGVASGTYTYTGFDVSEGTTSNPLEGADFDDFVKFRPTAAEGLSPRLTSNVVLGAEVPLITNLLSVGAIYNLTMRELYNSSQLTLAATLTPTRWLSASATYSSLGAQAGSSENFGLALNFHPSWINLFVGTDFMISEVTPQFVPIHQNNLNLYFGVSMPLARSKY